MASFKTPLPILQKIEQCRLKQEKRLDLSGGTAFGKFLLPYVPPELLTLTHLEELNLSGNAIQAVPDEIKQLQQLKRIDLRYNPLRQVPDIFGLILHYADFRKLKLSHQHIIGLKLTLFSYDTPEEIFDFPNLTELEITHHRLKQIPEWIFKLEKLTSLNLDGNRLSNLFGLENLGNLTYLNLGWNKLINLSGLENLRNLTSLDLSGNELTTLSGLENLGNLTSLNLGRNELSNLSGLENLRNLTYLNLGGNKLSNLSGLENLGNLTSLWLSHNKHDNSIDLTSLENLGNLISLNLSYNILVSLSNSEDLKNLTSLDLSGNYNIHNLPHLKKILNLTSLNLSHYGLSNLSKLTGLENLRNLASLDLSHNNLADADLADLGNLGNLTSLDLSHNIRLTDLSGLENLENLTYLGLSHNTRLTDLSGLENLENLTYLGLSRTRLIDLSDLENLGNLTSLDLSGNELITLPGLLENLGNLTSLDLSGNKLTTLSHLENLRNLTSLGLSRNRLTDLSCLENLGNLTSLDLSGNRLTTLSSLENLGNLISLYLSDNNLTNLSGLENSEHLSSLGVRNNLLTNIPEELLNLPKLEVLELANNNSITNPPIEQLELEGDLGVCNLFRVRNYFNQLRKEKDYLYEAKLLIVGEGEAGKTSLAKTIQDSEYKITKNSLESTKGIDVIRWEFPFNSEHRYRVNIWDFGGQEIYHATHQFFLTKRALYVLVADNRKGNTDFYYWLSVVELLSDKSPVLIVKNEKDDCLCDINEPVLRGQFENLKETYATNLQTRSKDFCKLFEALPFHLKQLPHIGQALPKRWIEVRNALETDPRHHITLQEFLDLCAKHGFKNNGDKLQLSETLHDLGSLLHFQNSPLLNKTIFLRPHWATQAVYHVLDNRQIKENFGKFTKKDLTKIWHEPQYDFMHDELLELMKKFKLCYPLQDYPDTFIAPQLLEVNKPPYPWPEKDHLTVFYKNYEFMPKGLLTQLIVALHPHIADQQRRVWRAGVVFEKDQAQVEVIEEYGKREIKIQVIGQNKRDLMTIVHHELQKIHNSYHKRLKYKVLLPCSCEEPEYFDYEILKEFAADRAEIQCQKRGCRKMVNAEDLIEGVLDNRELKRKGADDDEGRRGDVYHIHGAENVHIIHQEEKKIMNQKDEKPMKSSWANGSFYLIAVLLVPAVYGYLARDLPFYSLIIVLIAGIIVPIVMGIFQLRQDEKLKEKSFIELTKLIIGQLPLLGGILKDWVQRKE